MSHAEHIAAAVRTIMRAKQADTAILYAAKFLVKSCKRCQCNVCGNHPHKGKAQKHEHD